MNFKRLWIIFKARNREFFRDKAALGWNFLFPFLIVAGFAIIFGDKSYSDFKVGVFPHAPGRIQMTTQGVPETFFNTRHLEFIGFGTLAEGMQKLNHHKIDFLLKRGDTPYQYWISDTSPKGYIVEKMFLAALQPAHSTPQVAKNAIQGNEIRYIEWLFPGILAMNMMFSALWGVGYIVVRYRKNGVLKRLKATPLTAFEYLSAQLLSRIFVLMFTLVIIWVGCDLIFKFTVAGSYLDLCAAFLIGGLSLTAMGLLVASRGTSEEFTSGLLNFITWPMMFLSEVWFSIEGAPRWVQTVAQTFPLTHMLRAIRKIMNEGASLADVGLELTVLLLMTTACLSLGAKMFSWHK